MPRIVPRSCHRTSDSSLEVRVTGIAWGWIVRTWESGSQVRNAKTAMSPYQSSPSELTTSSAARHPRKS